MPFQEKSDAYTYIDASKATLDDRLKVTFENGLELYFKLQPADARGYREGLEVDIERTSPAIIADLHEKILDHERYQESHRLPFMRKRWTLEEIKSKVRLYITVEKSVFDQSPRVGSHQRVWGTIMGSGGMYTVGDHTLVERVESITVV